MNLKEFTYVDWHDKWNIVLLLLALLLLWFGLFSEWGIITNLMP